ncbi:YitT family protein [Jeotgalibaca sp. MA1X17-3]|uniref:YitT family protein n=1 Tax=Jeotgalibaca sp. MA1X17-3 TaxID=2908211 RepID=UPI001F3FDA89|nr:YitT family protein [Jeotgalibaca sp. MA1X17-3]UJF14659.1 YitT family protein [Jeotgalibaca sp. MA1X17-3]
MKRGLSRSIFLSVIGAFIFSIAINMFSIPNNLGEGGVTGLSLMIFYVSEIPVYISTIVFNGFILLIGYRYLDKRTMRLTIFATILTSIFLYLTADWNFIMEHAILAPLCSGALVGFGIGVIFQAGGSTAGTDIIALIINKYFGWSTSVSLLILDILIVVPSIFIIGLENVVLTIVHLYVQTKVLNFILEGYNPKKSVMIISEKHQEIANEIDRLLGRGMTLFNAEGYFRSNPTKVIMVVISRQQVMPLSRLVKQIDPNAFVVLTEVQSVTGEGFSYVLSDEESQQKINEFVEIGENLPTDADARKKRKKRS